VLPEVQESCQRLDELARRMREFLEALEGSSFEDDRIAGAWARCDEAYAELGDPAKLLEGLEPEPRALVEERVDEVLRLNAVLTSAVRRERDEMLQLLEQAGLSRKALQGYASPGEVGGTCDLSG